MFPVAVCSQLSNKAKKPKSLSVSALTLSSVKNRQNKSINCFVSEEMYNIISKVGGR